MSTRDTLITPFDGAGAPALHIETGEETIFARNLAALARSAPETVERLRATPARMDVQFLETSDGALSATLDGRALASRRRPLEEAKRLAEAVDVRTAAVFAVMGFGLGHHVGVLAQRLGRSGVILCFEPDLGLLRAVLERVDHSAWLESTNIAFFDDPRDAASISAAVQGLEGLVAMGVKIVEHGASVERLGDSAATFGETLARVVAAVRTNVLTTMVQVEITMRNLLMNADRYVASPGIEDLRGVLRGFPAVVVSAGPSLSRNIRELAKPGVRDRVCIVAVQTTLKPLLAAGVRPHFVVALDHHEISRRFYDGLRAEDVEDVTLVVEPKANAAILDAWPGAVRMPRDAMLDLILGDLADANRGAIRAGSTVAHLAHYLARHLGCDPVALVGQDLGFTDGQYYAAGAAIHEVWAAELNEFVSLELLEWQRIARHRPTLRRVEDHFGRPIYTDEQMATYLAQFERDFMEDAQRGLRVIDATEGGVRKPHTTVQPLAEFLGEHAARALPDLPPGAAPGEVPRQVRERVAARLRDLRQGVWRVARVCTTTEGVLAQMLEHHADQPRVNRLITEAQRLGQEAASVGAAYTLTQKFNQTGVFNRARDDRAILLDDLNPLERQRRQIERDARNVRWLGEAAEVLGGLLDAGQRAVHTGVRLTHDASAPAQRADTEDANGPATATSVAAVLLADTRFGSLGDKRDLFAPLGGRSVLEHTLDRLSRCEGVDSIVLLTDDPDRVRGLLGERRGGPPVRVERADLDGARAALRCVRSGRAFAASSWRGGIAGLTIFDEVVEPALAADTLERIGVNAALLVGADWALLDPALCDAVIARHRESSEHHRLVFTQAAPGLCGCVIDRALLREIAEARAKGALHASIGGLLAYNPLKPRADAVAKPICVQIDRAARDAGMRLVADTSASVAFLGRVLDKAGADCPNATDVARAARDPGVALAPASEIVLRLDDGATAPALRDALRGAPFRAATIEARRVNAPRIVVEAANLAREAGAAFVHVRVDSASTLSADDVLRAAPDVVSVDMHADSAEIYQEARGVDGFQRALTLLESLVRGASPTAWARTPWIVPRMVKRDASYEDVESFVDKWTLVFGHAALDAHDEAPAGDRIQPLPLPALAQERFARERVVVDLRGGVR